MEHSWNTSDPWGLYSSVGSAHKHSWNTRGTRQVDPDTVNPAHAWPFCGWSPVRIPVEHGFAFFQADHRFESGSCKKNFQLALALQAISKFRIGVDKDGQGVDRPERGASASFQVAKFEVLPALLHV